MFPSRFSGLSLLPAPLKLQKLFFQADPLRRTETAETTFTSDDTVAGDQERNFIFCHDVSNRPTGLGRPGDFRQLLVGESLSSGNVVTRPQDPSLERCPGVDLNRDSTQLDFGSARILLDLFFDTYSKPLDALGHAAGLNVDMERMRFAG